jgi:hypothetical protein
MKSLIRLGILLQLFAVALAAHSMSMSNSELSLEGQEAVLSIAIPSYEVQQLNDAEAAVLNAFTLSADGVEVPRVQGECAPNEAEESLECTARYLLPEEAAAIEVQCDLADTIIANHVHVLRAVSPDGAEQQVFDYSSRTHRFRFRPLGLLERWSIETRAGAIRILRGPAQLLFLFALVVAARSRRELLGMSAAFLATLAVTASVLSLFDWQSPPGFLDAAGALTIAYLAVETLTLPDAGGRWLVAGGMGAFHGLYFGLFLQQAPMLATAVLLGVILASAVVIALLYAIFARLVTTLGEGRVRTTSAIILCIIGIGWFSIGLI